MPASLPDARALVDGTDGVPLGNVVQIGFWMSMCVPAAAIQAWRDRGQPAGYIYLSVADALALAEYALTNTDLDGADDSRLAFCERVRAARIVAGHDTRNARSRRLTLPEDRLVAARRAKEVT